MNREQKIEAIYEKIARKDLSFGCKIFLKNQEIVMENQPVEYGTLESYEVMWFIIGRYWTQTYWWTTMEIEKIYFNEPFYNEEEVANDFKQDFYFDENNEEKNWDLEIIGHPVMIWDLLDWIENDYLWFAKNKTQLNSLEMNMFIAKTKDFNPSHIFEKWEQKRLPLEEQSDECVDFVYDLISE